MNYELLDYCKQNNITFTRSRAYKKNDQAHVEEKNGSIVRRLIGYDSYETEAAWEVMCRLYAVLRLYINFFQPTVCSSDAEQGFQQIANKYSNLMANKTAHSDTVILRFFPPSATDF